MLVYTFHVFSALILPWGHLKRLHFLHYNIVMHELFDHYYYYCLCIYIFWLHLVQGFFLYIFFPSVCVCCGLGFSCFAITFCVWLLMQVLIVWFYFIFCNTIVSHWCFLLCFISYLEDTSSFYMELLDINTNQLLFRCTVLVE